jgi:hypothetical protein
MFHFAATGIEDDGFAWIFTLLTANLRRRTQRKP